MRRWAAARKKLNTKKTPRLVYNTKYLQIYQIWRLKQPTNQSNKVPAPSLAKQIKYGLPYLIDLFDAECDSHDVSEDQSEIPCVFVCPHSNGT
jgi:hypothetical protein